MDMQTTPKKRLSWDDRHRQMIGVALDYVRREGADTLTLAKVAEQAGVAKPLAYDHFKTREGLLIEMCLEFDERQRAELIKLVADTRYTWRMALGTPSEAQAKVNMDRAAELLIENEYDEREGR